MIGFQKSRVKDYSYIILSLLTLGILPLVCLANSKLYARLKYKRCNLDQATIVLIEDVEKSLRSKRSHRHDEFCKVHEIELPIQHSKDFAPFFGRRLSASTAEDAGSYGLIRYVRYRGLRLIYDWSMKRFVKPYVTVDRLLSECVPASGLTSPDHLPRLILFGSNSYDVNDPLLSSKGVLKRELSHPFYIFQWVAILVWFLSPGYIAYAAFFLLVNAACLYIRFKHEYKYVKRIKKMISSQIEIAAVRDGQSFVTGSYSLVPGDVFEISGRLTLPCDAILLSGEVSVDESSLSGDPSIFRKIASSKAKAPFRMTSAPNITDASLASYSAEDDVPPESMLFGGSVIVAVHGDGATANRTLALVCGTGYSSKRGRIVRKALFERQSGLAFELQAFYSELVMIAVAIVVTILSYIATDSFFSRQSRYNQVVVAMDMVALALPPVYLASFTLAVVMASYRLQKKQVYSMTPNSIVAFGMVDCVLFDKTGTMTTRDFSLRDIIPVMNRSFLDSMRDPAMLPKDLLLSIACCHTLQVGSASSSIFGDPLEREGFMRSQFLFESGAEGLLTAPMWYDPSHRVTVRLENRSVLSADDRVTVTVVEEVFHPRSAVISEQKLTPLHLRRTVFLKGEPDSVLDWCNEASIPTNAHSVVHNFRIQGCKVLAYAFRVLADDETADVEAISCKSSRNFTLAGLVAFENTLRGDTKAVMQCLARSRIKSVMVTGDNPTTAIAVARASCLFDPDAAVEIGELGFGEHDDVCLGWRRVETTSQFGTDLSTLNRAAVPIYTELALTGDAAEFLLTACEPHQRMQLCALFARVRVFAQVSPSQKALITQFFSDALQCHVAFVGDGSNDVLAFSAAPVSLALSETPSSTICASFNTTSYDKDKFSSIGAVIRCIREGRSTIAGIVQAFKVLIVCTILQIAGTVLMYRYGIAGMSETQQFWINEIHFFPLVLILPFTAAYRKVSVLRLPGSLLSFQVIVSLFMQLFIQLSFLVSLEVYASTLPWSTKHESQSLVDVKSTVNTVMFTFSIFQYIIVAFVLNISKPFRKPIWRNIPFSLLLLLLLALDLYILLVPEAPIHDFLDLSMCPDLTVCEHTEGVPLSFRHRMLLIIGADFIVSYIVETLLVLSLETSAVAGKAAGSIRVCNILTSQLQVSPMESTLQSEKPQIFRSGHERNAAASPRRTMGFFSLSSS